MDESVTEPPKPEALDKCAACEKRRYAENISTYYLDSVNEIDTDRPLITNFYYVFYHLLHFDGKTFVMPLDETKEEQEATSNWISDLEKRFGISERDQCWILGWIPDEGLPQNPVNPNPPCPECKSTKTTKAGKRITRTGAKQHYLCRNCGRNFS